MTNYVIFPFFIDYFYIVQYIFLNDQVI